MQAKQASPVICMVGSIDAFRHTRLLQLYHSYSKADYGVYFIGMDRLRQRPKSHVVEGLKCEYLMAGWGYANWKLLIGLPLWCLRLFIYSLRMKADLAHTFELESALPVALGTLWRRTPFIYDVQDNYDLRHKWPFPLKTIIRWVDAWVMRRAASIIVPDENRIVGHFQRFRDKILVIPNCPPDRPAPPEAARRNSKDSLTILAMGHLGERRGVDLLLEAVRELPQVKIIMAGRFTDPQLEAKALSMPQVDFRGWIPWEEAIALGYQSDVVFSFYDPSYEVNLLANSQKWFDAMMTGTPILSNREIKNAQWIEQEDFGYLCSYGNVAELTETLRHILEQPQERAQKGRNSRRLYEQEFNWGLMEKKLLRMARAITSNNN